MSRVFVRELGGYHRLPPRICGISRPVSTAAQDADVQKPRRKGLAGLGSVFAGASIVGLSYYAMTWEPQPSPLPPVTTVQQGLPSQPGTPVPVSSASLLQPSTVVAARDELVQRMESLKTELEALRREKRDQLVDIKKKAIKEDIHTIESGLAALEKEKPS